MKRCSRQSSGPMANDRRSETLSPASASIESTGKFQRRNRRAGRDAELTFLTSLAYSSQAHIEAGGYLHGYSGVGAKQRGVAGGYYSERNKK